MALYSNHYADPNEPATNFVIKESIQANRKLSKMCFVAFLTTWNYSLLTGHPTATRFDITRRELPRPGRTERRGGDLDGGLLCAVVWTLSAARTGVEASS